MKVQFYLFLVGLFIGCNPNNKSQSSYIKADSLDLKDSVVNYSDLDFDTFLKKMSKDSVYQLLRIKFPIIKKNLTENGEEESTIVYDAWEHMDFENVAGVQREILAPTESIRHVRFFDPEIAIEVIYFFRKIEGKWFLVTIIDNSN